MGLDSRLVIGESSSGRPTEVYITSDDHIRILRLSLSSQCTVSNGAECTVYLENDQRLGVSTTPNNIIFYDSVFTNNAEWVIRTNNLYQRFTGTVNEQYFSFLNATLLASNSIGAIDASENETADDYFFVNQINSQSNLSVGANLSCQNMVGANLSCENMSTVLTLHQGTIPLAYDYRPIDIYLGAANVGAISSNLSVNSLIASPSGGTIRSCSV